MLATLFFKSSLKERMCTGFAVQEGLIILLFDVAIKFQRATMTSSLGSELPEACTAATFSVAMR